MRQRKSEAWAKWRELVGEQGRSGESVAAFCRERGLRNSQFLAWKKRLRKAEMAQFVDVEVKPSAEPLHLAPARSAAIEVRLTRGRSLVVEIGPR